MNNVTLSFSKRHMKIAAAVVAVLVILPFGLTALDLYAFGWRNPTLMRVAKALPYPALSVDGEQYSVAEYEAELTNLERILRESESSTSRTEMQRMLVDRISRAAAVKRLASGRSLDMEFATKTARSMTFGDKMTDEQIKTTVEEQFGWTMGYFENNVLLPFAREMAFALDVIKPQADEVAALVKASGADFAKVAKEKGEDATKESGGDLGFFKRGVMVPEFEAVAFSTARGEVVGPFASRFGWHMMKVTDVKGEGEEMEVRASHIIIALKNHEGDIEPLITNAMKDVKVKVYIKE